MRKNPRLPNKPSALILTALTDLNKIERNNRKYKINMEVWHSRCGDQKCAVCLAGSVIAARTGADPDHTLEPGDFSPAIRDKFLALDLFRGGYISDGLVSLGVETPACLKDHTEITDYHLNPKAFKKEMKQLAAILAACGH